VVWFKPSCWAISCGGIAIDAEGEDTGIVIQIVPVLTDVTVFPGALTERNVTLLGTGIEDPAVIHFGDFEIADDSRLQGDGPTFEILFLADGIPLGPISISSAGGTSAPFDGWAAGAVLAVAAVGTPPDPALPSANPRQTITIQGRGFTSQTPIVFTTLGPAGLGRGWVVWPSDVNADGTSMMVEASSPGGSPSRSTSTRSLRPLSAKTTSTRAAGPHRVRVSPQFVGFIPAQAHSRPNSPSPVIAARDDRR
jgi:hypothetical protein